jgi:hypothetical protein
MNLLLDGEELRELTDGEELRELTDEQVEKVRGLVDSLLAARPRRRR